MGGISTGRGGGDGPDPERAGMALVIEILVFATMFTLIVLLTGGPSNRL